MPTIIDGALGRGLRTAIIIVECNGSIHVARLRRTGGKWVVLDNPPGDCGTNVTNLLIDFADRLLTSELEWRRVECIATGVCRTPRLDTIHYGM